MSPAAAISFGPILHAGQVRDALQQTISKWSFTYLAELARRDGQTGVAPDHTLPDFRSYPDSLDTTTFPEDQLPACVLVVPGVTQQPEKRGRGIIRVRWAVGIGCVVGGPDRPRTVRLAQLYTAAVRALLLQKSSLGQVASGMQWLGERYNDAVIRDATRTLAAGTLLMTVDTDNVVDVTQGPTAPITDGIAPTGWPTVQTPVMTMKAEPVTQGVAS